MLNVERELQLINDILWEQVTIVAMNYNNVHTDVSYLLSLSTVINRCIDTFFF